MENSKIFIGNLDFSATEAELKSLLSKFGTVIAIKLNQKKGHAVVEMESSAVAVKAVQQLDGTKHRDREIRLSLYMKARKARSVSVRKYKERGATLARKRAERPKAPQGPHLAEQPNYSSRPARDDQKPGSARSSKPESRYTRRGRSDSLESRPERSYSRDRSGSARPPKRSWLAERPSSLGSPADDGARPAPARSSRSGSGFKPHERSDGREPRSERSYSLDRSGSARPSKKPWSAENPDYPGRPSRGGEKSGSTRPSKKEWSSPRPARSPLKPGDSRAERPDRKKTFGSKPRDASQTRSPGGSQNRFSKPTRSAKGGLRTSSSSLKLKPSAHSTIRGKSSKKD